MRWYANELGYGEDADFWATVGLLHDIDFEMWPEQHCQMCIRDRYRGDRTGFDTVRYRGMTADFSWGRSAAAYRHIYENL